MSDLWSYDSIQFPRLLMEIDAAMDPELDAHQIMLIARTTKLGGWEIEKIFRKAMRMWDSIVKRSSKLHRKRWLSPESVRSHPEFARLLTGIYQVGLSREQMRTLSESMGLPWGRIEELFLRAADAYMRELD